MKQVLFGDLEDGDIFMVRGIAYQKVLECREYNAVAVNKERYGFSFPSNMKVDCVYKQQ